MNRTRAFPHTSNPLLLALLMLAALAGNARAFSLEDVSARALALSKEDYRDHRKPVPKWMLDPEMSYDQWRDIRFNPEKSLWRGEGLPFQVQFFHPGLYYDRTVGVTVLEDGAEHPVPFDIRSFDYGKNDFASKIPSDIGFAGIRIHTPFRTPKYFDELIVFLGATYFRALGRDNVYGLSARGIAIDTVEPSGEEFPHFVHFWLEKPAPGVDHIVVLALMEGPSITGSYRFGVRPGASTVIDVESHLLAR
jgi:glucans biosynthesis protein